MNRRAGRLAVQAGQPFGAQCRRRLEAAVSVQIQLKKPVARARNMPTHRVQRFILAGKAVGGARVDQAQRGRGQQRQQLIGVQRGLQRRAQQKTAIAAYGGDGIQRAASGLERLRGLISIINTSGCQRCSQPKTPACQ